MKQLPYDYIIRMKKILGDEYPEYEKALNEPPVRGFRVNTDKISLEDFCKINPFGSEKIPYVKNGFYLDYDKVGNHPFHHAGMIYVQEPSAMMPCECVEINPDSVVLDMCAAPGGKSSQIKNKLNKNGLLVSNEINPSRCKTLTGNFERLGFKNCATVCVPTTYFRKLFDDEFDVIIADVPCSGEGMFRKDPAAIDEWSVENVKKCAVRQSEILESAVRCIAPGGTIIYSTCTFSLEENEMVIDNFLKKYSAFDLVEVNDEVKKVTSDGIRFDGCECKNIHYARRFYPHKARGEGQFVAVLRRHFPPRTRFYSDTRYGTPTDPGPIMSKFLKDTLASYDEYEFMFYGDKPVFMDQCMPLDKRISMLYGVTVGEIKEKYVLPHHQFFSAYGKDFKRKIELPPDSPELYKYLHGEEIPANCENGFAAVTVCGVPLGGAKVVKGRAKNYYPKGLRLK